MVRTKDSLVTTVIESSSLAGLATLTPTTNSDGSAIWVTEDPSVSHTRTVTAVITRTLTKTIRSHPSNEATVTIADIGDGVTITAGIQSINNHTTVKVIPQKPRGTLLPLTWNPKYKEEWKFFWYTEFDLRLYLQVHYGWINWADVDTISEHLRKHNGTLDINEADKYAAIMMLRNRPQMRQALYPTLSSAATDMSTAKVVRLNSTSFTLSQPTQTVDGVVYVNDPLNKYRMYDPMTNAVAPTAACDGGNVRECNIERCMWNNYMQPMNFTTVMPMAVYDTKGIRDVDYFTRVTEVHTPHWGVSDTAGLYYPTKRRTITINGTDTAQVARATPAWLDGLNWDGDQEIHGSPSCFDLETCHGLCSLQGRHGFWDGLMSPWWLLLGLLGLLGLAILIGLCFAVRRRRRNDPKDPNRKSSITEKLSRKPTQPTEVVVNTVTGTATGTSTGNAVDPAIATAVISGPAAGAEAGREKTQTTTTGGGGDDGKGTTGRRAEEGRGRVNFEDGSRPGNEPPTSTTTVTEVRPVDPTPDAAAASPPPTETEHTETRPAGQTDGTMEHSTGRHMPDMGSMRGRKRARPEGHGMGFNLGF